MRKSQNAVSVAAAAPFCRAARRENVMPLLHTPPSRMPRAPKRACRHVAVALPLVRARYVQRQEKASSCKEGTKQPWRAMLVRRQAVTVRRPPVAVCLFKPCFTARAARTKYVILNSKKCAPKHTARRRARRARQRRARVVVAVNSAFTRTARAHSARQVNAAEGGNEATSRTKS